MSVMLPTVRARLSPMPARRLAFALALVALVLWSLWPFLGSRVPVVLPLGGLVAFAGAWLAAGAALWPRRPRAGIALGALLYLVAGAIFVVVWNTQFRFFRGGPSFPLPAWSDPIQVVAGVLTWPWQLVTWTVLDWLT